MSARALLTVSAVCFGVAGAGMLFMPDALLAHVRQPQARILVLFVQAIGAAYLGFAMLNWMSRGSTIGGIYSRPLVIANLAVFLITGLSLVRWAIDGGPPGILIFASIFGAFAVAFGAVMMTGPKSRG